MADAYTGSAAIAGLVTTAYDRAVAQKNRHRVLLRSPWLVMA